MAYFDKAKMSNGTVVDVQDTKGRALADTKLDAAKTELNQTITTKVNEEAAARQEADTSIRSALTQESTARADADSELEAKINNIAETYVNVKKYGAKGDGITDDTAAIKAMYADVGYIVLGKGTFRVTDTIAVTGGCILGFGDASVLKMDATVNKPVVKASNRSFLQGFNICFASKPASAAQNSYIGILCGKDPYALQRTSIRNIHIYNVGTGIAMEDANSPVFEIHFDTIEITDFTYAGIEIITNGSTNCTFTNIYINNGNIETTAVYGFHLAGWMSSMEIPSLNVEWGSYNIPILIVGCADLNAGVIHMERLKLNAGYNGLLTVSSVSGRVGSLSAYYCDTTVPGTAVIRVKNATLWGDTENVGTPIGAVGQGACALYIDTLLLDRMNVDNGGISGSTDFCVFQRLQEFNNDYYTIYVGSYQYRPMSNDAESYLDKYVTTFNDNIQFLSKANLPTFATTLPDKRQCSKYRTMVYQTGENSYKIFNGFDWDTISIT